MGTTRPLYVIHVSISLPRPNLHKSCYSFNNGASILGFADLRLKILHGFKALEIADLERPCSCAARVLPRLSIRLRRLHHSDRPHSHHLRFQKLPFAPIPRLLRRRRPNPKKLRSAPPGVLSVPGPFPEPRLGFFRFRPLPRKCESHDLGDQVAGG